MPAAGEHTTHKRSRTSEEPWCSTAGERYKARVWEDIRNLFQQDELTDVMLAAEGRSIPCHRVLLAAASKFFHDKFGVHPESVDHNLLDIEGIEFDTLKAIVHFVYNGRIQLALEKAEKLLPASVSLMLPELTNMCEDFLLHKLDDDKSDCLDIHRIAKHNSLEKAAEKARDLITEHFQEVSKHDAFKEMSETDLQDYISDERLYVGNENPVFEAVVNWVRHDVENRKSSFEKLMENVNLSHCSKQFLSEVVRTEELMQTVNTCLRHLSDAMSHHMTSPQQFDTARIGYYTHFTPIVVYDDNAYTFKGRESEWVTNISSAGKMLEWSSACMTGDGIVITGGYDDSTKYCTQCWKLTLPILKWSALPDLNVARCQHATLCVGNQVYVLGGWNDRRLASVEYLDEQNKSWQVTCDMPSVLNWHTAVTHKHFIYVFGGYTFPGPSLATFMLDTVNKKWTRKAEMPDHCRYGCSVVNGNRIYVLGGYENCCMSYDPDQDQWQSRSEPAVSHETPSAVVWKDRILLCGGRDTSVIEEYNPNTDTWSGWKHQLPKSAKPAPVVFASNR